MNEINVTPNKTKQENNYGFTPSEPIEFGYIPKKNAAIEVYKRFKDTRAITIVAILTIFLTVAATLFGVIVASGVALIGTLYFMFKMAVSWREMKRLSIEYKFNPKVKQNV